MPDVTYPLDLTGMLSSNLIANEIHTVNEAHFRDHHFIIPNFSPFYVDNLELKLTMNGVTTTLVENQTFSFCMPYVTGTRETGKAMYGSITLHDLTQEGVLQLTYRTIGGEHVVNRLYVLEFLSDKIYNPRTTIWDIITNSPVAFPPVPHFEDYDNLYGQEEVVNKLQLIKEAIGSNAVDIKNALSDLLSERREAELNLINSLRLFIRKDGSVNMEGFLTLNGNPTEPLHAVTKAYLDLLVSTAFNSTTPASHVASTGDSHGIVTVYSNGFMSSSDKSKLDAISGTNTGDQTNISGNAGTATKLQNPVTINGISFNGDSNITLPIAEMIEIAISESNLNGLLMSCMEV